MEIYNARNLDHNSRFILSIVLGIPCAILLGFVYALPASLLNVILLVLYIPLVYALTYFLRWIGHGVTKKYMILGAVLTVLMILVGDLASSFTPGVALRFLMNPVAFARLSVSMILSRCTTPLGLVNLLFRVVIVAAGYKYAVIF